MNSETHIIESATVLILRQSSSGVEVLLAKRNHTLKFLPDHWVFPGGALEDGDHVQQHDDLQQALRNAAVREVEEEVAIAIAPAQLNYFAHWVTPASASKRYSTHFYWTFVDQATAAKAKVDGSELVAMQWFLAADAVMQQSRGQLPMLPPTLVSLMRLEACNGEAAVRNNLSFDKFESITPKMASMDDDLLMLYPGDVAFELVQPAAFAQTDGLHRCIYRDGVWRYIDSRSEVF